jgi:hypothetical protein
MPAPQYEQAGADIAGTGTLNTIPRWTGASTLGDSGLIDNGTKIYATARTFSVGTSTTNGQFDVKLSGQDTKLTVRDGFTSPNLSLTAASEAFTAYRDLEITALNIRLFTNGNNPRAIIDSTGNFGIDTASPVATAKLTLGGAANSTIKMSYQTGGTTEVAFDQMNTATGEFRHSSGVSSGWGGSHTFYTDTTEKVRIDANGNIYGTSGTTGMTNGFFYIPAAAGAPTGTPTAVSGRVPMYYDTTNNNFYVYNGAWKKVLLA